VLRRASRHILLFLAVPSCCGAIYTAPCAAQVEASLDAAASIVKYDGYLGSGAVALVPSVAWRSARSALGARGAVLVFESGNASIQGLLTAGTFSPALGPLRVEAAGEAGASVYAGFARFAHTLGRLRVHALGRRWGAWAGPLAGSFSRGEGVSRGAWGGSAGWWSRLPGGAVEVSWTRLAAGDTVFSDLQGRVRWRRDAFDVEAALGTRFGSRGGGTGTYGDLSTTVRLSESLALVVAGGSYPSDPVRGSIPGRYVTAGVRLAPRSSVRADAARRLGPFLEADPGVASSPRGRAEVSLEWLDGLAVLVVRAPGARRVEVMGDFTDWRPLTLTAAADGRWRYAGGLPSGLHRFNLRVDDGPWGTPRGAGVAADEFGGVAAVLVVP
jgi:hypothetical protein